MGGYLHLAWHARDAIYPVLTIDWPDSLGLFYAMFTGFLGFVPNADEWKVMGLAPYGKPGVDLSMFIDLHAMPYKVHHRPTRWK